ncbi:MAG: PAS domain S-box protein [Chitinophagaceae bacterium]|nr:MAG: PAS domain S-box protein [Chitinophagaceae bacterium]
MSDSEQIHLHLSDYFAASPDLVCIASKEGYFKKVNDTVVRLLGYSREELFARPIASFILEEDKANTHATRQKLLQGETLINFSNRYMAKSGSILWLEWTSIYFPENEVVLGIAKNITERKTKEKLVEDNYNRFKELASHFKTSIEKDRKSLAHGLHEELAQLATSAKMELDIIPIILPDLPEIALNKIGQAAEKTKLLIQEIQRLSFAISPALLSDFGLTATLQWLSKEFTRMHNIPCSFTSAFEEQNLSSEIKTDFFRICQEALSNVMLHAAPGNVDIYIYETDQHITLSILDDGRGFNSDAMPASGGLKNIKERASSINGNLEVQTAPGAGTKLTVVVQKDHA